ncbi:uncharacterized protein si:ch211-243a20.4 [Melanotaenia boesemani]|uniref:uncharacterized protein si:ch211-243a20.4 n=1 Tax=Melanotaenia boesemani TaxID=1250792 RepID=UPI001C05E0E0|nr:uncharacterized protein si:ch211-243a20.4 [Melanotaenia boesemani]
MEAQHLRPLSLMLTLILVFFLSSVCTGMDKANIKLESKVFVAFKGKDLSIGCEIKKPANETKSQLKCFNSHNIEIHSVDITAQGLQPGTETRNLHLKKLNDSGKYYCRYKQSQAYWFLRVRTEGYKHVEPWGYKEFSIVAVVTGGLLIFSVVGSVYVFRGHWKERITACGEADRKEKRKHTETEEDNMDVMAAQSTSFYASLEPRPRSIYDVLDHSAPRIEPKDPKKPNSKKTGLSEKVKETPDEGVFESVYENV